MKTIIISAALTLGLAGAATAQSTEGLCHHAGLTYSPGSMITMGQSLQRCAVTEGGMSVWTVAPEGETDLVSANCVSGGREFGHGAILPAGASDLKCSNGAWFLVN